MTDALTATAIAGDLTKGARTAVEVAEATLAVVETREALVQAYEFLDPNLIRAQAAAVDAGSKGPLAGVTIAVKDVIATKDMPTGHNTARYAGVRTGVDAACVDTLRTAGAVIFGKAVTTEFAATQRGGKTTNPNDPARTPGGSSSGSAAAVAAGMASIGLGTQTGGSVIRPASFNGVWGWKPTWNVISREGLKLYSLTCDTLGLYARDPVDFDLLADVFELDPAPRPATLSGLTIGMVKPPLWDQVEQSMRDAMDEAASLLEAAGAQVREILLPDAFDGIDEAHGRILAREGRAAFLNEVKACPDTIHDEFCAMTDNRQQLTPDQMRAAYALADTCRVLIHEQLDGIDALMAPSSCGEAPLGLDNTGDPSMNSMWTLLGLPVVSAPGLVGPAGMPLGISFIAPRYMDRTAIRIAALAGAEFAASQKADIPKVAQTHV